MANTAHASRNGLAIVPALLYFVVAYVVVTVLAAGLTITYGAINKSPNPRELGVGMLRPGFCGYSSLPRADHAAYLATLCLVVFQKAPTGQFAARIETDPVPCISLAAFSHGG